jgi:hypothetical protein
MPTLYMGDTASTSPAPPEYPLVAVAGYVAGYVSYPSLVERWYPDHHVLSITPNIYNHAEFLDVENGDAVPSQAGPWVREMLNAGVYRPGVYANHSTMPYVQESLRNEGLARSEYRLWVADWDGVAEVPEGFDAKQFYGTETGSWDYSVITPDFFAPAAPKPSMHYHRYAKYERPVVVRYDNLRKRRRLSKRGRLFLHVHERMCARFVGLIDRRANRTGWDKYDRRFRHDELCKRAKGQLVKPS